MATQPAQLGNLDRHPVGQVTTTNQPIRYFLGGAMVSLAALATRNLTTVLALILMVSPVWGLRPRRALRSALTSLPIPGMVNSPFFLVSLMAVSASSSRPAAACLFVISSFSAMWRTSAVLVIPFAMCVAPWFELVLRGAVGCFVARFASRAGVVG